MLKTSKEIIQILITLNDYYHLKSNYVIVGKAKAKDPSRREPFAPGFLSSIDCKKEILKGLKEMDARQRQILILYYSFSKSPDDIVKILNMSVRHLYRLKKKALDDLTELCNK
jgi:DNA-directed RNA polymerase specialized sigma subunit